VTRLSAATWTLALDLGVVATSGVVGVSLAAGLLLAGSATATPMGSTLPGCVPAYWTLEPDVRQVQSFQFDVWVTAEDRRVLWRSTYVYASRGCCQSHRNVVAEVVTRTQAPRTTVTECQ
jgi:hypothetical protein